MNIIQPSQAKRVYEICPVTLLTFGVLAPMLLIPMLGKLGTLGFLASGMALICLWPKQSYAGFMIHWVVLLLPLYALISVLWSLYPGATFRHALQFGFTIATAVMIGHRLGPRRCMYVIFTVFLIAALLSLVIGKIRFDGALLGIFGSKNAFAGVMSTFVIASVAITMDKHSKIPVRIIGIFSLLLGLYLLVGARSAGQILLTLPGLALIPIFIMLGRFSKIAKMVILSATFLLLLLGLVTVFSMQDQIAALILAETGKDMTLTGRTDIWAVGFDYIKERPILGVGYQAFWVRGHNSAEQIWAMFDIEERSGFNFHNMLIAAWVEGGIIGVGLQMWILLGGLFLCAKWALKTSTAESAFFTSFIFVKAITGFVEVPAFIHFSVTSIILVCGYIYGVRALYTVIRSKPMVRPTPLLLLGERNAILRP